MYVQQLTHGKELQLARGKERNMSEDKVIINFNNREYKAEDLNEEQMNIAIELNVIAKQLAEKQEAAQIFNSLNNYKKILIEAFDKTITKEEVVEEE